MRSIRTRVDRMAGLTIPEVARLAYRKGVHRKVALRRYEARAGDSIAPRTTTPLKIVVLGESRYEQVAASNPYLAGTDLVHFSRQTSVCIGALDGDRIAASTWMTKGAVYVHELHRVVPVPEHEHLSCRSYVDPDYRGMALLGHLVHAYASGIPDDDLMWALIYEWNVASIRSYERIGWRPTGEYWTRFLLGRAIAGERQFASIGGR